jgi:2-polyprenyl-6-methoxyphenol hydroxylase-like FAD-dependent oxidoreductase
VAALLALGSGSSPSGADEGPGPITAEPLTQWHTFTDDEETVIIATFLCVPKEDDLTLPVDGDENAELDERCGIERRATLSNAGRRLAGERRTMDTDHLAPPVSSGTGHAVVIGAGMAGLAIAQALTAGFGRVTVFDRDRLPTGTTPRRGVPQDRHLHLLLPAGINALDALFPGLVDQLCAEGAKTGDTDRIRMCLNAYRLAPARTGERAVFSSRPFLESHVRRRVREEPSIAVRDGVRIAGLAVARDGGRVEGVEVASADGEDREVLPAEVVVDCSGRRSSVPGWLAELGHRTVEVDELDVQVCYATCRYELPASVLDGDHHVLVGPTPNGPRGAAMTHVEDGSWIVTLFAMAGEQVPTDGDDFERFAAELPIGDVHDAIRAGRAINDPAPYRFPANRRHRYERLKDLPAGFLAAGDAVCSFNPIYGQGMTVAAIEARILQERLRSGGLPSARTWFGDIARVIDVAWQLAIGSDLAVEAVAGRRPLSVRMLNRYLARLQAAAVNDPRLTERLVRVVGMIDPPSHLLHPATIAPVLRGARRTR